MKKFLAALLAVPIMAVFARCNKPADEQLIDGITTAEAFSETSQTSAETAEATSETAETASEETSAKTTYESFSETEIEMEPFSETTTGVVSDTKMLTETVSESQILFADYDGAKFPMGVWQDNFFYTYECDEYGNITYNYYDENDTEIYSGSFKNYTESDAEIHDEKIFQKDSYIFEFDGEGHYRISLQTHDVLGEYTLEDNMLTLIFKNDYSEETFINRFCFEASKNENGYRLEFVPSKSTEMIELPAVRNMEHSADVELFVGLSALFDTFYARKSFCIEYIGEADADSFKDYIEYLKDIS